MYYKNTKQVAKILAISPSKLSRAVWDEKVDPPKKGPGGAFLWTAQDIRRAFWALLRKDLDSRILTELESEDHVEHGRETHAR